MTSAQFYVAIGVPILVNSGLFGVMMLHMNSKFEALSTRFDDLLKRLDQSYRASTR